MKTKVKGKEDGLDNDQWILDSTCAAGVAVGGDGGDGGVRHAVAGEHWMHLGVGDAGVVVAASVLVLVLVLVAAALVVVLALAPVLVLEIGVEVGYDLTGVDGLAAAAVDFVG